MTEMPKARFMELLALIVLLAAMLACATTPTTPPVSQPLPLQPKPSQTNTVQAPPNAQPPVSGTIHPTTLPEVLFLETDCPTNGFSGLTSNGSHGSLSCRYHWVGKAGVNNLQLTITQYNDPLDYKQVLDTEVTNFLPKELDSRKQDVRGTPGSHYSNYYLDLMEESDSSLIMLSTYQDSQTDIAPQLASCGDGHGFFGVDGKFVVELRVASCDLGDFIGEYRGVMNALKDAAEAAIARAEAARP
jgi:hypothetical protein